MTGRLRGRRVVVTRPAEQAAPLVALLEAEGAIVVVTPLIEIADETDALAELLALDLTTFDWVAVTSANGAARLPVLPDDSPRVAAVGATTAATLPRCDLVPSVQSAEGLLAELAPPGRAPARVLVVQAVDAEPTLVDGLRSRGWDVTVCSPYRSVPARLTAGQQLAALSADAVLFASGSAARAWVAVLGTTTPVVAVAIGPQTAAAARTVGLKIDTVATDHSLSGMVAALVRSLGMSN